MYICERCDKPCFVIETTESNCVEFWGRKEIMEEIWLTSECCENEVREVHEETFVHNEIWIECQRYVLEHGEFPESLLSPLPEDGGRLSMEEISHILDDEELAFLARQCFAQDKEAA